MDDELKNPSEAFVRFFASQVYDRNLTQQVIEQFTIIVKEARSQFINERIKERLQSALSANESEPIPAPIQDEDVVADDPAGRDGIETTQDEIDGYYIVKAILREVVDVKRIAMRDTRSYCGILLDDTNRKPICRLHFNRSQKYLGVFAGKKEERIEIEDVDDIFKYADRVKAVIADYEAN